ncbi:MAG: hypothetical protein ACLRPW_04645 [Intestinibacter sp.]
MPRSYAETGVDPIFIANQIYSAIQEITNREIVATQPVVITIGKFVGGGCKHNTWRSYYGRYYKNIR